MTLIEATAVTADGILHEDPSFRSHGGTAWTPPSAHWRRTRLPPRIPVGIVDYTVRSTHYHFDVELNPDEVSSGLVWVTSHADLHWGNLTRPTLFILDWETWRCAPGGYDVATLYCNSLLHRPSADRLRTQFGSVLASSSGQFALLSAACRYLWLSEEGGEFQELEKPLRELGASVIAGMRA